MLFWTEAVPPAEFLIPPPLAAELAVTVTFV
jgi:hypothetical protein